MLVPIVLEALASTCADKFCMMNSWFFAVWVWVPRLVRLRAFHHLWLFVIAPLWLCCLCPLSLPHCDIFFLTTWSVQITISSLCLHKYFGIFFLFSFLLFLKLESSDHNYENLFKSDFKSQVCAVL